MDDPFALSSQQSAQILEFLGCKREAPSIRYLNRLLQAYIRRVPWESASRIVRRHTTANTRQCPRWPQEFWGDALSIGTGGTCFENNLAFHTLLTGLGFQGYLTINDMEKPGAHAANIVTLGERKYLADVAIPMHVSIPLNSQATTRRWTPYHNYTLQPLGGSRYLVQRSHHPKRNIFTLVDTPVLMDDYRDAVCRDYEPSGYFLDRVIIVKIIDDRLWRFSSAEQPFKLEGFGKFSKQEVLLSPESMAHTIAERFQMEESVIAEALSYLP